MILNNGVWAGQRAVLVGGGPSLKTFDWSLLAGEPNVIVVNRAWKDVPNAAIFFTEDYRVITELWGSTPEWKAFRGIKILHALDPHYAKLALDVDPTIHIIHRKREDKFWSRSLDEGLSYSSNSMIGALNLADILGAEPICLLGVDCNPVRGERFMSNYHSDYLEDWKVNAHQLDSFKSDFEHWAALHLGHREIINCNPNSGVTCWPIADPKEIFQSQCASK